MVEVSVDMTAERSVVLRANYLVASRVCQMVVLSVKSRGGVMAALLDFEMVNLKESRTAVWTVIQKAYLMVDLLAEYWGNYEVVEMVDSKEAKMVMKLGPS